MVLQRNRVERWRMAAHSVGAGFLAEGADHPARRADQRDGFLDRGGMDAALPPTCGRPDRRHHHPPLHHSHASRHHSRHGRWGDRRIGDPRPVGGLRRLLRAIVESANEGGCLTMSAIAPTPAALLRLSARLALDDGASVTEEAESEMAEICADHERQDAAAEDRLLAMAAAHGMRPLLYRFLLRTALGSPASLP